MNQLKGVYTVQVARDIPSFELSVEPREACTHSDIFVGL